MAEKIDKMKRWIKILVLVLIIALGGLIGNSVLPPILFPPTPPTGSTAVTLYFVNEQHTINGLSAYKLNETNSNSYTFVSYCKEGGSYTVWVAVRVWLRHSSESETELTDGTYNVNVSRSSAGQGIQTVNWNCPQTAVSSGDALVIRVYLKVGSSAWQKKATFITDQLDWKVLESATWTFHLYTHRVYYPAEPKWGLPAETDVYFKWGSSSYESKITNIVYSTELPAPSATSEDCIQIDSENWESQVYWDGLGAQLDFAWICTNRTGQLLNESFTSLSGTSAWANITLPLNGTYIIKWRQYCNNTQGSVGASDWHYFYPKPVYTQAGHTSIYENEECTFYSYWKGTKLHLGIIEHNATGQFTNQTVNMGDNEEGWLNYTVTLSQAYRTVAYRFCMQDSDGQWSVTPYFEFYTWKKSIEMLERKLGPSGWAGRNAIYIKGARSAFYYAYLNSCDASYYVVAYDISNETWHGPCKVGSAPESDLHWQPGIGYFPNGSLIVTYGFAQQNITYRISIYSAFNEANLTKLITNWNPEKKIELSTNACYPRPISIDDKLMILFKKGPITMGSWALAVWNSNSDDWTIKDLIYNPDGILYLDCSIIEDKILIAGRNYDITKKLYYDYFLFYSDDYGETWKHYNGTQLNLPIKTTDVTAIEKNNAGMPTVTLDSQGHPIMTLPEVNRSRYFYPLTLARYTKSLGIAGGTWEIYNATLENGNVIYTAEFYPRIFLDKYYLQLSFWLSIPENLQEKNLKFSKTAKFVCTGRKWYEFRITHEIYNSTADDYRLISQCVIDNFAYPTFQVIGLIEEYSILGKYEKGTQAYNTPSKDYLWATKFIAQKNATILGFRIYVKNITTPAEVKIAIYDSDKNLIATGCGTARTWIPSVAFPEWDQWSHNIALNQTVEIEAGKTYWLAFRLPYYADFQLFYDTEGQSILKEYDWNSDWETTLTGTIYGCEFSVCTLDSEIFAIYGYTENVTCISCGPSVGYRAMPTEFYAKWLGLNGLSHAMFYWNATGTWQLNGTLTFTDEPFEAWSNFTRTLPDQELTIAWYIVANDTVGHWGNTSIQILNVLSYTNLSVGWNNFTAWSVDVGHTLAQVNASLAIDNINWTVISLEYPNGTRAVLVWEQDTNEYIGEEDATVESGCTFYIYCLEAGKWYHSYP